MCRVLVLLYIAQKLRDTVRRGVVRQPFALVHACASIRMVLVGSEIKCIVVLVRVRVDLSLQVVDHLAVALEHCLCQFHAHLCLQMLSICKELPRSFLIGASGYLHHHSTTSCNYQLSTHNFDTLVLP